MKAIQENIEHFFLVNINMLGCILTISLHKPLFAHIFYFLFPASLFVSICSQFAMVTDHSCFMSEGYGNQGFERWMAN